MSKKTDKLLSVLKLQPVVPVLIIDDVATAVPLARALVAGGLKAIEITLRTTAALEAIRAVANEVEGAVAGAGTILNAAQYRGGGRSRLAVHRQPRHDAGTDRCRQRFRHPAAAGCGHRQRSHGPARRRLRRHEVLPGRTGRRRRLPEVAVLAACRHARSARPAASRCRMRRITCRCPTSSASAVPGSRRRSWSPRATGQASPGLRPKPSR